MSWELTWDERKESEGWSRANVPTMTVRKTSVSLWTVPAICWENGGQALTAVTFGRAFFLLPRAGIVYFRGRPCPGYPAVRRLRESLSPGGTASLLFPGLQGRGESQKEPGAHEEKAAGNRLVPLRFALSKSPGFQGILPLFSGPEYPNTFRSGSRGYFAIISTSGQVGSRLERRNPR